jgi:hypothetical protein
MSLYNISDMKKIISTLSASLFLMPLITFAHPGHGETGGYTITHYFVEPMHSLVLLTAFGASLLLIRQMRRSRQQGKNK